MTEPQDLSERELDVLRLVATGATNQQIARELSISKNTVKVHLRNIFAKTETASRTEAAMYAVQHGLVLPDGSTPEAGGATLESQFSSEVIGAPRRAEAPPAPLLSRVLARPAWLVAAAVVVVALMAAGAVFGSRLTQPDPQAAVDPLPQTPLPGWRTLAPLPAPRRGLAVAEFQGQLYAVGGETGEAVSAEFTRYDPELDRWEPLPDKPVPVTDARSAAVGARLYVPGGRLQGGQVTDALEIYDPLEGRWLTGAPMPVALSAYALAAYEGQLFLFGGWDGARYVDHTLVYDPGEDRWAEGTPMPTARGYASAAGSGARIFVMGGSDGQSALATHEAYTPALEEGEGAPWESLAPLPEGRFQMGAISVIDTVYLMGGRGDPSPLSSLRYVPRGNVWETSELRLNAPWSDFGFVSIGSDVYAVGGVIDGEIVDQNIAYQAVFTIAIPVIR